MTADEGSKKAKCGGRRETLTGEPPRSAPGAGAGGVCAKVVFQSAAVVRSRPNTNSRRQPGFRLQEGFTKALWKSFIAPLQFLWDYSCIIGPARDAFTEPEHWRDYVAAVLYLAFAAAMLLFLAAHVSTAFVVSGVLILGSIVALKFALYYFS